MKERPILFSGAMIRAILAGQKTQTRRVAKPVRHPDLGHICTPGSLVLEREPQHVIDRACPYGQPGDRLWVRESWRTDSTLDAKPPSSFKAWPIFYSADGKIIKHGSFFGDTDGKTRPGIHMPRWACRILLEIVSVRVERLQDICEADAEAEGCAAEPCDHKRQNCEDIGCCGPTAVGAYRYLWDSINGAGSWAANPWVWVVEFKRVEEQPR